MRSGALRILSEVKSVIRTVSDEQTDKFIDALVKAKRIYIAGVGRSGLVVKAFGQRLMHLGFEVHLADEITAPGISRRDLLVVCSGTGRTNITIYMARKARKVRAKVASITAMTNSPLARVSNIVVHIKAPLDVNRNSRGIKTIQPARTLFEQSMLVYLDSVVLDLMQKLKISPRKLSRRHMNLE